jgi:hypothetical protein
VLARPLSEKRRPGSRRAERCSPVFNAPLSNTLAVDTSGGWFLVSSLMTPFLVTQMFHDTTPGSCLAPAVKYTVYSNDRSSLVHCATDSRSGSHRRYRLRPDADLRAGAPAHPIAYSALTTVARLFPIDRHSHRLRRVFFRPFW